MKVTLRAKAATPARQELRRAAHYLDGVTVAEEIEPADKFENMNAQMVREVASKTNDIAGRRHDDGDGARRGDRARGREVGRGRDDPMDLKRGIDLAVDAAVEDIKARAKKVTGHQLCSAARPLQERNVTYGDGTRPSCRRSRRHDRDNALVLFLSALHYSWHRAIVPAQQRKRKATGHAQTEVKEYFR